MGKLRTKLGELEKEVTVLTTKHGNVFGKLLELLTSVQNQFGVLTEGTNALYLYLVGKFKAKGDSVDKHHKDLLTAHMDDQIKTMVKQLLVSKASCQAFGKQVLYMYNTDLPILLANLNDPAGTIAEVQAMIVKRKAKFFNSKKYKDKMKKYADQLAALEKEIATSKKAVAAKIKGTPRIYKGLLDTYNFTGTTTVGDVHQMISADLNGYMSALNTDWQSAQDSEQKVGLTRIAKQIAILKAWGAEADGMEAEAEEG